MQTQLEQVALLAFLCGLLLFFLGKKVEEMHSELKRYIHLSDLRPIPTGMPIVAKGVVHAEHPLLTPISQKEAIYYKYSIDQQVLESSHGDGTKMWQNISPQTEKKIPFTLVDNEGKAYIDPNEGTVESSIVTEKIFHSFSDLGNSHKSFLEGVINTIFMPEGDNIMYRSQEVALFVGQTVNVFGVARVEGDRIYIGTSKDYPLVISTRSRDALISGDAQFAKTLIWVGGIAIVVSLTLLLLVRV